MIQIYTDGASIGNPGKVGVGYLIYKNKQLIAKKGLYLGVQSNNFAEYMALVFALLEALRLNEKKCEVFSDSQLLCEQIHGNYKVKNNNIYPLFILVQELIGQLDTFSITHIAREKNSEADALAKEATGFLR